MRGCARLIGYGIHFLRERKLTARPAPMRRDGKGMHMKKLKTLLCVVFVLATVICLCVSVSAMDKDTPPTTEECTSKCKDGAEHKFELKSSAYTCAHSGYYYWQCSVCHISYYMYDQKAVIPHQYKILEETAGKRTYRCINCSNTYSIETSGLCKHEWTEPKAVEAGKTCGEEVKCTHECTKCGAIEYVYVKVEHNFANLTQDCTKDEVCTICGEVKAGTGNKTHNVTKWEDYNGSMHIGHCENEGCSVIVKEAHEAKTAYDGDCTIDVKCSKCGHVVLNGTDGHNLIPKFYSENDSYWDYVENPDGTHSRICSNDGCTVVTGVDTHEAGKEGAENYCPLCAALKASAPVTPDETTNEPAADEPKPVEPTVDEPKPVEPTVTVEGVAEPATVTAAEAPAVAAKYKDYVAYDIEAEIVSGGVAKVSIPIPEGWDNVKVYHVDGDTLTDMHATVVDGNAVFTTNHFSVYAIVNVDTDLDNQNQTSASTDTPTSDPAEPTTDAPATDAPATDEPVGGGDIAPAPGDGSVIAPAPETDGETVAPKLGDSDLPMLLTVIAVGAAAAFVSIAAVKKQRGE